MNGKTKVILINRPLIRKKEFHIPRRKWQPLNLLYIATTLFNKDVSVEIIDARAMDYSLEDIKNILCKKSPKIVLVASDPFDFYQCPNPSMESFYSLVETVKGLGVRSVLSIGPQASIFDKSLLKETGLDYIIKGDSPLRAADFIFDLLSNKKNIDYTNISFKKKNKIFLGEVKHIENLDELPIGNYKLLPMEKYKPNMSIFPEGNFAIITTSRGCPFQCKYCFKKLIGNKIRKMSLERTEKELDELVFKNKVKVIYFLDDFFTFSYQRIYDLCNLIKSKKYNIVWGCQTRPDAVSEELLKKMKNTNCVYISYGVETGSQDVANRANKNLDLKKTEKTLELTQKIGIYPHINMLYGFPGETKEEFSETVNFIIRNDQDALPGRIRFYPGCAYYNEFIPDKSLKQAELISSKLGLSHLKEKHIEKGLAKINIHRLISQKKYSWKIFYFYFKYFFPSLFLGLKNIIKK